MNNEVPQEEVRRRLKDIAHAVDERLPEGYGFIVLAFPFASEDGTVNYVSNAKREDTIHALKAWLIKASGPEEWMKHIT